MTVDVGDVLSDSVERVLSAAGLGLFVRQSVVLGGRGVVGALSHSTGLVRDDLGASLVVVLLLLILGGLNWFLSGAIPVAAISYAVSALYATYSISLVTSAYLQAAGSGQQGARP
jgi:hypothetical protein